MKAKTINGRECKVCKRDLPSDMFSIQHYKNNPNRKSHLKSECKECGAKRTAENRRKHPAKVKASELKYRANNPSEVKLIKQRYIEKNPIILEVCRSLEIRRNRESAKAAKNHHNEWTGKEELNLIKLKQSGMTYRNIAKIMGRSIFTLAKRMQMLRKA